MVARLRASVALCSLGSLLSSAGSNPAWRQQVHPFPATAASQDASGVVYTEADGRWHVMPDCEGGYAPAGGLSWCHLSSKYLPVPVCHPTQLDSYSCGRAAACRRC
jgi:hypothetical protein